MNKDYRIIFHGTLTQESALSIGGNDGAGSKVDMPMARDGQGRLVLRGESITGAMVSTARKLFKDLPPEISDAATGQRQPRPSCWLPHNSHPETAPVTDFRQGVAIDEETGAQSDGALYDMETVPYQTRWPFVFEIKLNKASDAQRLTDITVAVLREWAAARCWLGRSVARGSGWFRLEDVTALHLTAEHVTLWPDSTRVDKTTLLTELAAAQNTKTSSLDEFSCRDQADTEWSFLEYNFSLSAGISASGYGVNMLSVGGHLANRNLMEDWDHEHYVHPEGMRASMLNNHFSPDHTLAATLNAKGAVEPFVPGSGLRGPMRHHLNRWINALSHDSAGHDSAAITASRNTFNRLFGSLENSALLLVRDAHLDASDWRAVIMHHHAEDELAGGVYGHALYNRMALISGTLNGRIIVECPDQDFRDKARDMLNAFFKQAEKGRIGIGGRQWSGQGWLPWKIKHRPESPQASNTEAVA